MESKIIRKAARGDTEALTLLVDEYKDIAYNLALSIVKNPEDARDITQDSFLKVLEKIGCFRNDSKFSTWLYRIVYNQSVGFLKTVNRTCHIDDEIHGNKPGNDNNQEEKIQELYRAINALANTDRNVIMLFYLAEKSVKEIALITGLSQGNIKVILHRARKKIYNIMGHESE